MIKRELYMTRNDGVKLYRTYSDNNFMIKQIESGNIYQEAIDVENSKNTYEETNEKIQIEEINSDNAEELWEEVVLDGLK